MHIEFCTRTKQIGCMSLVTSKETSAPEAHPQCACKNIPAAQNRPLKSCTDSIRQISRFACPERQQRAGMSEHGMASTAV